MTSLFHEFAATPVNIYRRYVSFGQIGRLSDQHKRPLAGYWYPSDRTLLAEFPATAPRLA